MSAERGGGAFARAAGMLPTALLGCVLAGRMIPLQASLGAPPRAPAGASPSANVARTATPPSMGDDEGLSDLLRDASLDGSLRAAVIVRDGKRRTMDALFRAKTEAVTDGGSGTGSPAAERRCEAAVGKATGHVCDAAELKRSASFGIAVPRGWCLPAGGGGEAREGVWNEGAGRVEAVGMGESWPVLCCD